jgi:hypothetical protein
MARFKFVNVNPLGELEEDCVCRAISNAVREDYYTVQERLHLVGKLFDCEMLCVSCYKFLLDDVYKLDRLDEFSGMTINEAAEHLRKGTFLIRVDGHLTILRDGIIEDIWDCGEEEIRVIWCI